MGYMSRMGSTPVWGVDPAVIALAIERARRERSLAVWALLKSVFGRGAGPVREASELSAVATR